MLEFAEGGEINGNTLDDVDRMTVKELRVALRETTAIVCSLTLKSGFVVIGKAACFSHDIFDEQMGCELAYQDAIRHLWELEAYRLKENAVMQKVEV